MWSNSTLFACSLLLGLTVLFSFLFRRALPAASQGNITSHSYKRLPFNFSPCFLPLLDHTVDAPVRVCTYNFLGTRLGIESLQHLFFDHTCSGSTGNSTFALGIASPDATDFTGLSPVHSELRSMRLDSFARSAHATVLIVNEPPRINPTAYAWLRSDPTAQSVSLILHHGSATDLPLQNALPWPIIDSWIPLSMWGMHSRQKCARFLQVVNAVTAAGTCGTRSLHQYFKAAQIATSLELNMLT